MAKHLNISFGGRAYGLTPTKVERKKIYGWTEIRDVVAHPCDFYLMHPMAIDEL